MTNNKKFLDSIGLGFFYNLLDKIFLRKADVSLWAMENDSPVDVILQDEDYYTFRIKDKYFTIKNPGDTESNSQTLALQLDTVNKSDFENTELVIATSLTDLNNRKADSKDVPEVIPISGTEINTLF